MNHDGFAGQPAGRFDATSITETIRRALDAAGLDTRGGPMRQVTDTIEQALSAAGLMPRPHAPHARGTTIDGTAREVDEEPNVPAPRRGEFLARSFTAAAGTRAYKVYVPARYWATPDEPLPMVVMLHGCTQSPDDFAAGTRMNALAEEQGFIVVYPGQCAKANAQRCWNWFRAADQGRESGEPAIIAGMTRAVASTYRVDARRIFVAGMSSGAAMAVILGARFPDLYAAIGAHSGLAYGVAHDLPSALAAMRGAGPSKSAAHAAIAVPAIVFHGDGDRTVNPRNATRIVEQAIARPHDAALQSNATTGTAAGGRRYSRVDYMDGSNRIVAEHWTLHGAGHAWSGGSPAGSFTDARGPDASKEMLRFFFSLPRAGTA